MKCQNIKFKSGRALAALSLKLGKISADSACAFIYHQPKMPEALKILKNRKK
ncbi:cyclic lactone autoinducer peptide [Petralouisia muris]|jgi:cyclic lactone autoinducer peptide|uniref:Cyclic lactone autoinducer peptide n=1 Tax=Petralouisia muris TaxID=3032872 RepID=A0AC61RMA7_9FIRM|nr:cyclic lactone autoinducer peptide [Petralouisia muris]TGY86903.1 cyclic lactone autoinducer peptide [Petralouisia muris]